MEWAEGMLYPKMHPELQKRGKMFHFEKKQDLNFKSSRIHTFSSEVPTW